MTAIPLPLTAAAPPVGAAPRTDITLSGPAVAPLLAAAQAGDRAAQADVLRSLQDKWYRFSLALLRDPHLARDATQETALRVLSGLAAFRHQSTLETWSLGVALNVCRELRRRASRMPRLRECEPVDPPEVHAQTGERRAALQALLQTLTDRQREIVVLRYFEELSIDQIARIMNCATGTVKATLFQALRALRNRWRDQP